ncbi:MAG: hypothetical protein CMI13_12210 [Oleibacter sp.]|nr:hypothetical protein [Thalassolituus sp.]|tara:strand:+ start:519 stop:1022 length:504 start_codon:yes stop_codon:yes gene_type:complete
MAVSSTNTLQNIHSQVGAMAKKAMNSDFTVVIAGYDQFQFLTKQFPWAVLTPGEGVEVAAPMGTVEWQASQVHVNQQGAISLYETEDGMVDNMLVSMLVNGGTFDCVVYQGTPERFTKAKRYRKCFINAEPVDRDWENRTQPMMVTGTLFYHYYGEDLDGNVDTIDG